MIFDVCTLYRKEDSGNYSCQAYNVEGQVESATQQLIVMCKCLKRHSSCCVYAYSNNETSLTHFGEKSKVLFYLKNVEDFATKCSLGEVSSI